MGCWGCQLIVLETSRHPIRPFFYFLRDNVNVPRLTVMSTLVINISSVLLLCHPCSSCCARVSYELLGLREVLLNLSRMFFYFLVSNDEAMPPRQRPYPTLLSLQPSFFRGGGMLYDTFEILDNLDSFALLNCSS
jgi:hypothetical protein